MAILEIIVHILLVVACIIVTGVMCYRAATKPPHV